MKITSRSSPWTFSRFLTKNGSAAARAKNSSHAGSSRRSRSSSVADRLRLRDAEGRHAERQTPLGGLGPLLRACSITARATASASPGLVRVLPRS